MKTVEGKATEYADGMYPNTDSNDYSRTPANEWDACYDGYVAGYNEAMSRQSSPKIKQLEWVEVWEGHEDAKTPFGHYVVRPSIDNKEFRMINPRKITQSYSTLSEAKAAAQADFEKRVMECLDLKAQQKQRLINMMRWDEEIGLYDDNPKNHGYER